MEIRGEIDMINFIPVEESSVLDSIKLKLGLTKEQMPFDHDIIVSINSAFMTLYQLGIGYNNSAIYITGQHEKWENFGIVTSYQQWIKDYIYMRVRLAFDPPTSSFVLKSFEDQIKELEWRIEVERDNELMDGKV